LRYGIPDFKMEKWVLDRRLGQLEAEGVRFLTGVEAGVDVSTEELRSSHDAVCLAVGAEAPRDLEITGRKLRGIHFAMDFLIQQNRRIAGEAFKPADEIAARGKRVVILGGGDTGSDCLGTVLRQSCREVRQVDIQPRPGTPRTSHAHEEGGERLWGIRTLEFIGENGWVKKLRCLDSDGGPRELPADLVLIAAGFKAPARQRLLDGLSIERDSRGNVKTDPAFMTNVPGVFAAGDAKRGASLIVWAIAEGLKMASAVDRYLTLSRVQTFSKNRSRFRKDRKA
jgi:glutamate synthase (NADPH/NADH) small chain